MANISDGWGDISLQGEWGEKEIGLVNRMFEATSKWYYDLCIDEPFGKNSLCRSFYGNGRWTITTNLEWLTSRWDKSDTPEESLSVFCADDMKALVEAMDEKALTMDVSYTDEEGGCGLLEQGHYVFGPNADTGRLKVLEESSESFEHNWDNYIEVTDNPEAMEDTETSILLALGHTPPFDEEKRDTVCDWAKKRTNPHFFARDRKGLVKATSKREVRELEKMLKKRIERRNK